VRRGTLRQRDLVYRRDLAQRIADLRDRSIARQVRQRCRVPALDDPGDEQLQILCLLGVERSELDSQPRAAGPFVDGNVGHAAAPLESEILRRAAQRNPGFGVLFGAKRALDHHAASMQVQRLAGDFGCTELEGGVQTSQKPVSASFRRFLTHLGVLFKV